MGFSDATIERRAWCGILGLRGIVVECVTCVVTSDARFSRWREMKPSYDAERQAQLEAEAVVRHPSREVRGNDGNSGERQTQQCRSHVVNLPR